MCVCGVQSDMHQGRGASAGTEGQHACDISEGRSLAYVLTESSIVHENCWKCTVSVPRVSHTTWMFVKMLFMFLNLQLTVVIFILLTSALCTILCTFIEIESSYRYLANKVLKNIKIVLMEKPQQ